MLIDLDSHFAVRVAALREQGMFRCCGQPFAAPDALPCRQVRDWAEARRFYESSRWENTTLEARNQITAYLSASHQESYRQWNSTAQYARDVLLPPLFAEVQKFAHATNQGEVFVHCVRWDFLGAAMEEAYRAFDLPTSFFTELLGVYEAGHFPCGWAGGKWPRGSLVVY